MGMTLEEYEASDLMAENEFLRKQLAETLKHRRMFEADYENRLKADMAAMLTDIQLEIDELEVPLLYLAEDYEGGVLDCKKIIQQKINALSRGNEE